MVAIFTAAGFMATGACAGGTGGVCRVCQAGGTADAAPRRLRTSGQEARSAPGGAGRVGAGSVQGWSAASGVSPGYGAVRRRRLSGPPLRPPPAGAHHAHWPPRPAGARAGPRAQRCGSARRPAGW
ncbi:conserved hypothetical protein [Ricinus communis]|uniref:Uncharacterized protein n=1 Tax=Ricinus communis TaxID=3988 RepID=B9TFJ5_RICCO|nr:conserved hypothetical protein [Ricinus communis]